MGEKPTESGHLGTKFLGLFFGCILAVIYAVLQFFQHPTLTIDVLYNIAIVEAFFLLVWVLIWILAEILWRYAHKYSEKFPIQMSNTLCAVTNVYRR